MTKDFSTRFYSNDAKRLFMRMGKKFYAKWHTGQMKHAIGRFIEPKVNPDGEIILCSNGYYENSIWGKDDASIRKWLAIHLKLAVRDDYEWDRSNYCQVDWASDDGVAFSVSDLYLVYDYLLNRGKCIDSKYTDAQKARIIGRQRDPITTELVIAHKEKLDALETEAHNAKEDVWREYRQKVNDYDCQCQRERDEKISAINTERHKKIEEENESYHKMLAITESSAA